MKAEVIVPVALQIRIDDVAWMKGEDERHLNRPSRSGLPRKHHPLDYLALNEIGKKLDMKLGCSLVLGEWDKNNRLRGVPYVSWDPEGWDAAGQLDMDYANACFENLDGSEYLDYTLHGLCHGYYDNGKIVTEMQYYPNVYDPVKGCYTNDWRYLTKDELRTHLDLFLQIYNDWGFKKEIVSFAGPCGCKGTPESNAAYAEVLREYGILYWNNGWGNYDDNVGVTQGIICAKGFEVVRWNAFDVDPMLLPIKLTEGMEKPQTDFCFHWTNFIRYHPEHNFERVDAWVDYFNRHGDIFGVMLSRDTAFADSQAVYNRFARVTATETGCTIDLTQVDNKNAIGLKNEFYISIRGGAKPKTVTGGTAEVYDTRKDFVTYKITRTQGNVTITY